MVISTHGIGLHVLHQLIEYFAPTWLKPIFSCASACPFVAWMAVAVYLQPPLPCGSNVSAAVKNHVAEAGSVAGNWARVQTSRRQ
jgi:hypothetical protein